MSVLEVPAAAGLVLPWLTDIAPVLTPIAALGLALLMIGAAIVHTRRREPHAYLVNAALFVLAVAVA